MRLLWVTAEAPDFRLGGGAIRQAHLLRGLAGEGAEVDLLVLGAVADARVRTSAARVIEVLPPDPGSGPAGLAALRRRSPTVRRLSDLARVAAGVPSEVADRRAERSTLGAALGRLRAESSGAAPAYAVVHLEHLGLAGIAPAGLARLRSLGVQNVPSRMSAQSREVAPGRRQRWLRGQEEAAARRFQRKALAAVDVVAVVSAGDATALGLPPAAAPGPGPAVMIVPNGVEADAFAPTPLPDEPRLVFTGTLDYLPNVDGVMWFTEHVLPLVRRQVPDVRLDIVGRRPVTEVRGLAVAGGSVHVHADVASVAPHLAAARVALVPLRIGTGSRLKALEAMAAGRPVVGTSVGFEGLDGIANGRNALVADDSGGLADAVVTTLRDDEKARRLAGAGRDLVDERYRWDGIAKRYATGLAALAAPS